MAKPNITQMQNTFDTVNSTIDNYFKANPLSKWVANYQNARDMDYNQAEIERLRKEIEKVKTSKNDTQILAFKNQNASQILNVHKIGGITSDITPDKYMIYGNGGCLRTNIDTATGKTSITPVMCDASDPNQIFKTKQFQETSQSAIYASVFHIMPDNTDMCLQFTHSGLSVQPCDNTYNKKEQNFAKLDRYVRL